MIAFSIQNGKKSTIYTIHSDGSNLTTILEDTVSMGNPIFTPDKRNIIFGKQVHNSFNGTELFIMNVNGSDVRQLTHGDTPFGGFQPYLSSDGQTILFTSMRERD